MKNLKIIKAVIFLSIAFFILISGCTLMDEYSIEGATWKLSSVALLSSIFWDDDYYRFKDGIGALTHKNSTSTRRFTYSMSSNTIRLRNNEGETSGLADNTYKIYLYNGEMIWYNSNGIECYRFIED